MAVAGGADLTVTRNTQWSAPGCHNGCGVLHYTDKDGNLVKIEGDPKQPHLQRPPVHALPGGARSRVRTIRRLYNPLKRVGERGENKWERHQLGRGL